ncbi:MAG TPA: hypothetical protein VMF65_13015 [Acidimicrobiales bacterium]|nr:hypothetical protein [Acidimicrobiales bacterium]
MAVPGLPGAVAMLGLAGGNAAGAQAVPAMAAAIPSIVRPCGTLTGRPVADQVLLIWEENHTYSSIIGNAAAPELNRLAAKCGLATQYDAPTHPSLPNYMEMTSGRSFTSWPWTSDCDPQAACTTSAGSIFSELVLAKKQRRSYVESTGNNCGLASYGQYAAKHNPAAYYIITPDQAHL